MHMQLTNAYVQGQNAPCNHIDTDSVRYMFKFFLPVIKSTAMSLYSNISCLGIWWIKFFLPRCTYYVVSLAVQSHKSMYIL